KDRALGQRWRSPCVNCNGSKRLPKISVSPNGNAATSRVFYARCKSPRHYLTIHAYPLNHITKTAMQSTSESSPANSRSRVLFASLVGTTTEFYEIGRASCRERV